MGDAMNGKCDICGVETSLRRKTYYYDIDCDCHSPQHFEIVNHCSKCEPKASDVTIVIMKPKDKRIENVDRLPKAIEVLQNELKIDKEEGSYYHSWQCNIAMSFRDTIPNIDHAKANEAAKRFLDLLIG